MADSNVLVLSAPLCSTFSLLKRHPSDFVKSVVGDYYPTVAISAAKDRLLSDIDGLKPDKWIRPPPRRGDNKLKHDLDDIIAAHGAMEERGLLAKLPKYVIDDLEDAPTLRMERGEFAVLVSKLDRLSEDLSDARLKITSASKARWSDIMTNSIAPTDGVMRDCPLMSDSAENANSSDVNDMPGDEPWLARKTKKRKTRSSPSATQQSSGANGGQPSRLGGRAEHPTPAVPAVKSRTRMIGRATASSKSAPIFKSAKPYVKKAIYGLYNTDFNESVESLVDYLHNGLQIQTITCYETNTGQEDRTTRAYRVCIDAKDTEKFLDPNNWADGIVIREWRFKPHPDPRRENNPNSGNARERPGTAHRGAASSMDTSDVQHRSGQPNESQSITASCPPSSDGGT